MPKWTKYIGLGLKISSLIIPGVSAVEEGFSVITDKTASNATKRQAVIDTALGGVALTEYFTRNPELLNDADIREAAGKMTDATVALLKVLERKQPTPPLSPPIG